MRKIETMLLDFVGVFLPMALLTILLVNDTTGYLVQMMQQNPYVFMALLAVVSISWAFMSLFGGLILDLIVRIGLANEHIKKRREQIIKAFGFAVMLLGLVIVVVTIVLNIK